MASFSCSTSDEGVPTHTSDLQADTEYACISVFEQWLNADNSLARDAYGIKRSDRGTALPGCSRVRAVCMRTRVRACALRACVRPCVRAFFHRSICACMCMCVGVYASVYWRLGGG